MALLLLAHFEIPYHYPSFRGLAAMVAVVVVAARACLAGTPSARRALAAAAGGLCCAAQLLTLEAGAYALVAAMAVPAVAALWSRARPAKGTRRRGSGARTWQSSPSSSSSSASCSCCWPWPSPQRPGGPAGSSTTIAAPCTMQGYFLTLGVPWPFPRVPTLALGLAAALILGLAVRRILWGLSLVSLIQLKAP